MSLNHAVSDEPQLLTHPHEPVLGLESLLGLLVIVNQTETSGSTTTELGLESKGGNPGLVGLVESAKLLVDLSLGDGSSGGVENVDNELTTVQKSVGDELSGSDGDRAGRILNEQKASSN